jgi:hypothetical protein
MYKKRAGRKATQPKAKTPNGQGLKPGDVRATYIVKDYMVQAMKDSALLRGVMLKEAIQEAITDYLNKYINQSNEKKEV